MRALTGLGAFDWFLLGLYAMALALLWRSWTADVDGTRRGRILLVPAIAGIAGIVALAAAFPGETADALGRIPDRTWAIAFAAATLIVALALVDFLLANTVRWPAGVLSDRGVGRPPSTVDALVALNVAAVTAIALAGLDKLPRPDADALGAESARVRILATYDAGKVVDLVFRSEREGYVATDDTISRFVLPREPGGRFELHPVASVEHARGLAIAGDALFVSELGRLPCDPDPCEGYEFPGIATEAGDRRYLMQAHGHVEAFDVEADGSVSGRRVIVRDLPVANTLHAVNGITAGPDGLLYLPIGNLDALYAHPGIAEELGVARADLLGTIVRFAPDGSRFEVLARGIRNVYDLTFDERGGLYGVDNNGPTLNGWREEELLRVRRGANYGYPFNGSFAPYTVRTDPPLYAVPAAGSGGIEWGGNLGLRNGVLVGSCGAITELRLRRRTPPVVEQPSDVSDILHVPACVSTIEPGPDGTTVAGLYRFPGDNGPSLYVLEIAR